jgi:predicted TIM-barrel enzyme
VKRAAANVPVLVASGATIATLASLAKVSDGVIVGTALRKGSVPGGPIDLGLAKHFADAFRSAFV